MRVKFRTSLLSYKEWVIHNKSWVYKFAWLPVRVSGSHIIWLESYLARIRAHPVPVVIGNINCGTHTLHVWECKLKGARTAWVSAISKDVWV